MLIFFATFIFSFLISLLIVKFSHHFIAQKDNSVSAVQAAHSVPTPRFGGIAIIISFSVLGIYSNIVPINLITGLFPLILIGILEDLKIEIRPRYRLAVATISAVFCIFYYCGPISEIDFLPLKGLLGVFPIALALTAFAIVGMINAINMIDGLNGFSGFQSIIMLSAIAMLSSNVNDTDVFFISIILISAIIGFLFLNFPKGYIFMGDTGAYCIGFLIAALSIKLHNENSDISSWAILLILLWPVSDLLMSIYRRLRRKVDTKKPDFMHFHHVVMRTVEVVRGNAIDRNKSNPLATLILAPLSCLPALIATFSYNKPIICFVAVVFFGFLFIVTYSATIRFAIQNAARMQTKKNKN